MFSYEEELEMMVQAGQAILDKYRALKAQGKWASERRKLKSCLKMFHFYCVNKPDLALRSGHILTALKREGIK